MKDQLSKPYESDPLVFVTNDNDISSFTDATALTAPALPVAKKQKLSFLPLTGALIFAVVYTLPILEFEPLAHTCLALLSMIAFLWGTEAIPSYASAYLVPMFGVWLGIGYDPATGQRIPGPKLATALAGRFMDPMIMIFLGSMTMSEALTKLNITDRLSRLVFKRMSKQPKYILISLMLLNMVIAAFLSNVASTTLVLSFTLPIIRSLDPDDPFIKALLFGIAWSGNAGGMPTPIASPQNVLAAQCIRDKTPSHISFMEWVYFAAPVSLVLCFLSWFYLMYRFKPHRSTIVVGATEPEYESWGLKHNFASFITVLTISLWTVEDLFSNTLGHIGISSMIPVVCFFGSGILTVKDFHGIRWSTLALMGSGLALGDCMNTSGLLDLVKTCSSFLRGIPMWPLLVIFMLFIGILASLINSTSAAAILFPVIAALGKDSGHPALMVAVCSLMVSGGQLFHISSFPNALMSGVCKHRLGAPEDVSQVPFLTGSEFFKVGWPTLFSGVLVASTIGYGITIGLGL